jgi:hypothetical protein
MISFSSCASLQRLTISWERASESASARCVVGVLSSSRPASDAWISSSLARVLLTSGRLYGWKSLEPEDISVLLFYNRQQQAR